MGTEFDKVIKHAGQKLRHNPSWRLEQHLVNFKKFLAVEDKRLQIQHRYALEGRKICALRARMVDLILSHLYDIALEEYSQTHPNDPSQCALVATGGYGRGELNFHSDIDILFLFSDGVGTFGEFLLGKILYFLWDMGLTVGHSSRSIRDALAMCEGDLVTRTALLESRFVCGDVMIFNYLTGKMEERYAKPPLAVQAYMNAKLQERDERHVKYGSSLYLQEPNVKESLGGIRDLHNVLWILRLRYGSLDLGLIRTHHLCSNGDAKALEKAYDFLLAVRNELHLCAGKKMDILIRQYQVRAAENFGARGHGDFSASENFMKKYYLHARTVALLTSGILAKLRGGLPGASPSGPVARQQPLEHGLLQSDHAITLDKRHADAFRRDPLLIFRIFSIAQQRGLAIHEDLKALIRNHLFCIEKKFQTSPQAARIFLEILSRKGSVGSTVRVMHETGVLGKYIPEFGKITCLVQDSQYHFYTTDEHTIKALEYVDDLNSPTPSAHDTIVRVYSDLKRPEWLYLALLLHDLGKAAPEEHVRVSNALAQKILKRLGVSPEDSQRVLFLIREHLSLSHTAQRRDLTDSTTIMDFSVLVKSPENLNHLLLMTYSDSNAVAPGIWTHWKEALAVELYSRTEEWLTGRAAPLAHSPELLVQTRDKVARILRHKVSPEQIERHLHAMPVRYPVFTPIPLIAKHVMLAKNLPGRPFLLDWNVPAGMETMPEVTICTKDRLGLFEIFAGCFTLNDINIISAKISTRADGIVLDTFRVNSSGNFPMETRIMDKFKVSLQKALEGSLNLDTTVKRHETHNRSRCVQEKIAPPIVLLDNRISSSKTVLEIQATDRLGLLFHISKVLASLKLNIAAAKISTERSLAYDVFYLTDNSGGKIFDFSLQSKILHTIRKELETRPAPPS